MNTYKLIKELNLPEEKDILLEESEDFNKLERKYIELAFTELEEDEEESRYISYSIYKNNNELLCTTAFSSPAEFATIKEKYWVVETKHPARTRKSRNGMLKKYKKYSTFRYIFNQDINIVPEIQLDPNESVRQVEVKKAVPYHYGTNDIYVELLENWKERGLLSF